MRIYSKKYFFILILLLTFSFIISSFTNASMPLAGAQVDEYCVKIINTEEYSGHTFLLFIDDLTYSTNLERDSEIIKIENDNCISIINKRDSDVDNKDVKLYAIKNEDYNLIPNEFKFNREYLLTLPSPTLLRASLDIIGPREKDYEKIVTVVEITSLSEPYLDLKYTINHLKSDGSMQEIYRTENELKDNVIFSFFLVFFIVLIIAIIVLIKRLLSKRKINK